MTFRFGVEQCCNCLRQSQPRPLDDWNIESGDWSYASGVLSIEDENALILTWIDDICKRTRMDASGFGLSVEYHMRGSGDVLGLIFGYEDADNYLWLRAEGRRSEYANDLLQLWRRTSGVDEMLGEWEISVSYFLATNNLLAVCYVPGNEYSDPILTLFITAGLFYPLERVTLAAPILGPGIGLFTEVLIDPGLTSSPVLFEDLKLHWSPELATATAGERLNCICECRCHLVRENLPVRELELVSSGTVANGAACTAFAQCDAVLEDETWILSCTNNNVGQAPAKPYGCVWLFSNLNRSCFCPLNGWHWLAELQEDEYGDVWAVLSLGCNVPGGISYHTGTIWKKNLGAKPIDGNGLDVTFTSTDIVQDGFGAANRCDFTSLVLNLRVPA